MKMKMKTVEETPNRERGVVPAPARHRNSDICFRDREEGGNSAQRRTRAGLVNSCDDGGVL